ncbi:MAG TPA: AMP-binding protein [Ktedonobacteraceae bacterium]|nr:AMP-binding protein [Ktedonobacteraceae bacterium]
MRQKHMLCIHQHIQWWAQKTPAAVAIEAVERPPLTYQRLYTQVDYVARQLRMMGIQKNDRVGLVVPNGPEAAVAFLTIASAATVAPLNPGYRANEFTFYLSDLKVKALIIQSDLESPAREAARSLNLPVIPLQPLTSDAAGLFQLGQEQTSGFSERDFAQEDSIALLLHTSGTTSRPKLVPLKHRNIVNSAHNIQAVLALTPNDRCLNIMPLFHIHGLIAGVLASIVSGAHAVCTPGFHAPQFIPWLSTFQPTWYTAVPTMHQAIVERALAHPNVLDHCSLRCIRSSSSALPPPILKKLERTFQATVIEAYGMTEASHQIASNPLPPQQPKAGSVGRAAGTEVSIMDERGQLLSPGETGEIVLKGSTIMEGYEDNPTANSQAFTNGWFRTGDQGYIDSYGYIFIAGRLKELINRGGEKIAPREIDEVLLTHPAVAQAVAFAIPHEKLGEAVAAAVVLRAEQAVTAKELREFTAQQLADFKVPEHIIFLETIPKGPTGKIQRIGLAKTLELITNDLNQIPKQPFVAPRTPLEKLLTDIWGQILHLEQVSIHDHFIDLGGDSVLAALTIAKIRETLQIPLSFIEFLDAPTVAEQVMAITRYQTSTIDKEELTSMLALLEHLSDEEAHNLLYKSNFSETSDS